ncbi:DnaJ domain-containing protein [Thermomonas brevis]|uniref:DnaJ domain-containing protein n=1 Tax=Thermomonas brevis TaxID=215691 RepID=A0A7G9QUF5_9GAMM|nr:J domain-containing protein [Thermomonas brevis]QNN46980.1 DnaJ domain-containing protein [Thermomonas brevis]
MGGAMGSALEWALALLQAPGERHVLRQKPLPQGMELLLGIAAGAMPEALAEASRRLGEPESRLREAARFYAREVLFHSQADAYRVLGVEAGASGEQIKTHHRLLQLWLHPDRSHSEDDAVFATRVNAAWNRLRTPDRRQVYDEALRQQRPPEIFDSNGALRSVRAWIPEDAAAAAAPSRWRRRLPVLLLLGLCGVLALLALRDMGHPSVQWEDASRPVAAVDAEDPEPDVLSLPAKAPVPAADAVRPAALGSAPVRMAALGVVEPPALPADLAESRLPAGMPSSVTASRPVEVSRPAATMAAHRTSAGTEALCGVGTCISEPPAEEPSPLPASPSFARIQSVRQAGDQLLRYMRTPTMAAPPIWSSPAVEASADLLRRQLHGAGRVRLDDAQWRVGGEEAVLTTGLIMRGDNAGTGRLIASLQWRDGYWLVTGLSMERTQ